MDSVTLELQFFFQSEGNKNTHSFASKPLFFLSCNKEVYICVSWRSPKADLETKIFKLRKSRF